jgi:hypothetical protein
MMKCQILFSANVAVSLTVVASARKRVDSMTGLENLDPKLRRQYESTYGPFVAGDYSIGQQVAAHGVGGEVIWSFRKNGTGPLTYVIDDGSGWPAEVETSDVLA